uniref:Uncharacterized protein n=1 Tax=viral metagenome TaxID=1070528 RepID=A0A6H1ZCA6_9ZZZZ
MDKSAQELTETAMGIYEALQNYAISTPDKYECAVVELKRAKTILKALDEEEKRITKPINDGLKKARDFFRPAKARLQEIIDKVNLEMSRFRAIQQKKAKEEQEKIDKQADREDIFIPQVEVNIPQTEVKIRKNYRYEVVNPAEIRPQFMCPDDKAIKEIVFKMKEKAVDIVGGIRVYFTETSF